MGFWLRQYIIKDVVYQAMNEVKVFKNEQFGSIRTMETDGNVWFVGKDVALALGYKNATKALHDNVDDEDKVVTKVTTSGGMQVRIKYSP